jgi:RNA polymerase primary sigma factor
MIEQLTKLKNSTAELRAALNREPSNEELSKAVGVPMSRIEILIAAARSASSLDTPMGGDDEAASLKDVVEDDRAAPDEDFEGSSLKADIEAMLKDLNEREAAVLRLRFGLEDGREWTLEDIGEVLDVTRERIRQIEAKALRKLQVGAAPLRAG